MRLTNDREWAQNPLAGECALRVLFAPPFASQVPHLRQANCGLARLVGTKITSQNPLAGWG